MKMMSAFRLCFSKNPISLVIQTGAYVGEKLAYPMITLVLCALALAEKAVKSRTMTERNFNFIIPPISLCNRWQNVNDKSSQSGKCRIVGVVILTKEIVWAWTQHLYMTHS